jgi:hypothetical protein
MPKDNLHWGGVEHRSLHNYNGALFHQATAEVPPNCGPSRCFAAESILMSRL